MKTLAIAALLALSGCCAARGHKIYDERAHYKGTESDLIRHKCAVCGHEDFSFSPCNGHRGEK